MRLQDFASNTSSTPYKETTSNLGITGTDYYSKHHPSALHMLKSVRIVADDLESNKNLMIANTASVENLNHPKPQGGLHPKIYRISSNKQLHRQPHGYIPKVHATTVKKVVPKTNNLLDNFVLEAVPKKGPPQLTVNNVGEQSQHIQNQKLQKQKTPQVFKEESSSDEGSLGDLQNNFDQDLLDNNVVEQIERYKRKKQKRQQKLHKMKRDYDKADVQTRVSHYDKKALYEELKLKELEIRQALLTPQHPLQGERSNSSEKKRDKIQRNILFSREGLTTASSSQGYRVPNIPYSSMAQFQNMSEKERYLKISHEFNKLKSHIEAHKYEDYEHCYQYLVAKMGAKVDLTRDMVKNFLSFIKDDHRQFDLTKNIDDIILWVLNGCQGMDQEDADSVSPLKRVTSVEDRNVRVARDDYQDRLLDVIQEYQHDLGCNYKLWNEKYEYDYNAVPRKLPLTGVSGPRKRANRRKNKLTYTRKLPHAVGAQKIHNILSEYIDDKKVLGAKEVIPPSLQQEFSCAINFNKETVNTVLNYAQESRVKLMNSLSTNDLIRKPSTFQVPQFQDKRKKSSKDMHRSTTHAASTASLSTIGAMQKQGSQNLSQDPYVGVGYGKLNKVLNTESESVYKRNNLMLEHVMLERAVKRLQSRKEKREEKKMQQAKQQSNDWKLRQAMTNEVFQQKQIRAHTAQVLSQANSLKQL